MELNLPSSRQLFRSILLHGYALKASLQCDGFDNIFASVVAAVLSVIMVLF